MQHGRSAGRGRRSVAVAGACALVLGVGCTPRRHSTGAATIVDVCEGYHLYDEQREPHLHDAGAVARYADAVARSLAAIDLKMSARGKDVTPEVASAVDVLRRDAERLRADASSAHDDASLQAALGRHAEDPDTARADAALGRFDRTVCERLQGTG